MPPSCRLLTSWPLHSGLGSGVAMVVRSLQSQLTNSGFHPEVVCSNITGSSYIGSSIRRIIFNFTDGRSSGGLPVVGFDFDGFLLSKKIPFASINGGILSDIVQFESGMVRQMLRLMAMLERLACQRADVIFTPSQYTADKVVQLYGIDRGKIAIMPNGIFFNQWRSLIEKAEPEKSKAPVILAVARLYKRKNLAALIRIAKPLSHRFAGLQINIVGDGLEMSMLKQLVKELAVQGNVNLLGNETSRTALARLYANCDVFCLPSLHETFGLVYLEAMAAGKPVVALNCTAMPELIRHGVDGLLAVPDDDEDLLNCITSLLKEPDRIEQMGQAGMKRAKEKYDWPIVSEPLIKWLKGVSNV